MLRPNLPKKRNLTPLNRSRPTLPRVNRHQHGLTPVNANRDAVPRDLEADAVNKVNVAPAAKIVKMADKENIDVGLDALTPSPIVRCRIIRRQSTATDIARRDTDLVIESIGMNVAMIIVVLMVHAAGLGRDAISQREATVETDRMVRAIRNVIA